MEKYQWHVDLVKEITPWEEPTKLGWNMNRGQNIALRLRAGRKSFLSREEIMETMFHELGIRNVFLKIRSQKPDASNHSK